MYFETLLATVLFCLGWRMVTDEGQILNFLRKTFDKAWDNIDFYENKIQVLDCTHYKRLLKLNKFIAYIGKPLVTCITCLSSVWGVSVFVALNGINGSLILPIIFNSIAAAFIQTFIWSLYVKHIK